MQTPGIPPAAQTTQPAHDLGLEAAFFQPTLESLEAGLLTLAHSLGREHALRVRRAMNGVLMASTSQALAAPPTDLNSESASGLLPTLPPSAALLGTTLDSNSLEQAAA